jgi:hypothetical protein
MKASTSFRRLTSFLRGLGVGLLELHAQPGDLLLEVEGGQHLLDGLGADHGLEGVLAEFLLGVEEFVLVQELVLLERRQPRLGDHEALEIERALQVLERHVDQQADAAGQRLEEPDVRHGAGQLDVAHALAPHLGQRHFHAALLADDAAVLHPLVLAAEALVVLDRPEDTGTEQAIAFRLERAVVDGLRLLDLTVRPREDPLRAGDRDANLIEALGSARLAEEIHQLLHLYLPSPV